MMIRQSFSYVISINANLLREFKEYNAVYVYYFEFIAVDFIYDIASVWCHIDLHVAAQKIYDTNCFSNLAFRQFICLSARYRAARLTTNV